jgi:hypothetical protein
MCLRPCGDDALSDAVQAAAAWASATKAAAIAVPAMWPGAAMSCDLGVWQRRPEAQSIGTGLEPKRQRRPNRLREGDTAAQDEPRRRPPGSRCHDVPGGRDDRE